MTLSRKSGSKQIQITNPILWFVPPLNNVLSLSSSFIHRYTQLPMHLSFPLPSHPQLAQPHQALALTTLFQSDWPSSIHSTLPRIFANSTPDIESSLLVTIASRCRYGHHGVVDSHETRRIPRMLKSFAQADGTQESVLGAQKCIHMPLRLWERFLG